VKTYAPLIYSTVGLAALFLILVALNFLIASVPERIDLTQGKLYTLSPATRKILESLDSPVRIRLYISRGDSGVPLQLRGFAQRVQDMVREFKSIAGPNLILETYNPQPDSEAEDAAQLDGVEPQQTISGEQFYLGAAVSQLDRKQVLPALSPQRENLLEYDLIKAVVRVTQPEKPVIGVMSSMPVLGVNANPFTGQGSDPWVLASELRRDYRVKDVRVTAQSIEPDIGVLLVIHPRDITPQTEYALDQFVLRGGKLIAFVDPYAYFDQQQVMPGMPGQPTSSTLPTLFKAWGLDMATGKVVSDLEYAAGAGPRRTPTVLALDRGAFDQDDVVTSQIDSLLYPFGGAFTIKPVAGLKATVLVHSSPNSALVPDSAATDSGDAATRDFKSSGKEWPLALRLTGRFKTAFPSGPPAVPAEEKKKTAAPTGAQLKESANVNSVVVVADADMLADGAAVDVQQMFGRKVIVPSNGNLAFAEDLVDQFASGDALIALRSRASSFRPLTVVRQMEANAQKQYLGKIQALQADLEQTSAKLSQLQSARGPGAKSTQILSPQEQAELDRFRTQVAETKLELKALRNRLRRDAQSLVFWTKVANIALMPILVTLFGIGVAIVRRRKQAAL
jgi:gliding motility-associatede transport system auxiliary component